MTPLCPTHGTAKFQMWAMRRGRRTRNGWRCDACHLEQSRASIDLNRVRRLRYVEAHPERVCESSRESFLRTAKRNRAIVAVEAERRGGGCEEPGCTVPYDAEADQRSGLHWHHRDPETKEFNVSTGIQGSVRRLRAELAKCELLCRRHHFERHTGLSAVAA